MLPALFLMLVIFLFSAQPSSNLPHFDWLDAIFKKGGHMLGYALLALSYWWFFGLSDDKRWLAWLLAFLYALSDEFHQSFVPGRHPSLWDVMIFDNLGALIALWVGHMYRKKKRPSLVRPVVEEASARS